MKNIRWILPLTAALALLGFAALSGCDGSSKPIGPGAGPTYTIQGAVVKDANRNGTVSVAAAVSDDTTVSAITVQFTGDTLLFNDPNFAFFTGIDSVYSYTRTPATSLTPGQHWLYLMDSSGFKDSIITAVADTFSITTVTPPNRLLNGLQQAAMEWSTTSFVDGYVIAAVKKGKAYQNTGYAAVAASGVNSGTIPPNAFLSSDGISPDTGLYYLYVYAYYGSPDSALVSNLLPTYFPFQAADNIDFDFVTGRFGTVTVTAHDSVHVVVAK